MKKTELKRLRPLKASAQMLKAYREDLPEQKKRTGIQVLPFL